MRLYLCGPMRGRPNYNYAMFNSAATKLRVTGYDVISPVELDQEYGDIHKVTIDVLLERDFSEIRNSDGLALLDGFMDSEGSRKEIAHAANFGLRVGTVQFWLDNWAMFIT